MKKQAAEAQEPAATLDGAMIKALAVSLATRAVTEKRPEPIAEASPSERAEKRKARHRRILDRYVRGVEPKPGQRWKSRLQKREK